MQRTRKKKQTCCSLSWRLPWQQPYIYTCCFCPLLKKMLSAWTMTDRHGRRTLDAAIYTGRAVQDHLMMQQGQEQTSWDLFGTIVEFVLLPLVVVWENKIFFDPTKKINVIDHLREFIFLGICSFKDLHFETASFICPRLLYLLCRGSILSLTLASSAMNSGPSSNNSASLALFHLSLRLLNNS